MALFKCKMCGGALEINNNETVAVCEYCGMQQTLPRLDDERKANLYDRANHFRRNNEFDKAMGIYEQILNEDNADGEAYWSLVLCRYGIEYVEDPASRKRLPTVNRAQFTSVFDDDNYKSALRYADASQKAIYEVEAKAINEIQKGILAISQREEPFDVFICYKETDHNGRRTPDSVLAQELYYQLTQEGFKVFFSRITLEDKLGSAYEPYIFAALNSAKVMVVLGTKPEFFKAVWVRNEWSRYLALIKQGQKKMLIPAYKDMDPYDLPEEFSHLQAQDMSKLGFMQDLIRGIKKIAVVETPKVTAVKETATNSINVNTSPLLKRAFIFLEDEDWDSAEEYCEKVLDADPECAEAYLGKLMAELQVNTQGKLKDQNESFENMGNYQKALRFADEKLKAVLIGYIDHIDTRHKDNIYNRAKNAMGSAMLAVEFKEAARLFETICDYKDAAVLAQECYDKADAAKKDRIFTEGNILMGGKTVSHYEKAIDLFESISGWKDADAQVVVCHQKIEEIKAKQAAEEKERARLAELSRKETERIAKRNKKIAIIVASIVCAIIVFGIVLTTVIIPNSKYNNAIALMNVGNLDEAYSIFTELGDYKDAADKAEAIRLSKTKEQLKGIKAGNYIKFGVYEQDNSTSNGKEDIEWLVLEVKDGKALVISKYALDCKPYNTTHTDVTWKTCTLRQWLNDDFINAAFSVEKVLISTATVSAYKNPNYSTDPGIATQDQVFLLSITEANDYFNSNSARQCKPTDYAAANGAYVNNSYGNCRWHLRTPGIEQTRDAIVSDSGAINSFGDTVNVSDIAVRPALWIDLGDI